MVSIKVIHSLTRGCAKQALLCQQPMYKVLVPTEKMGKMLLNLTYLPHL